MITFVRTASILPGKRTKAMAWALEVAALAKATHGAPTYISRPVGGNPNRIRLTTQHESLAAFEAGMATLSSHPKYLELLASGPDLFLSESVFDEMWQDV